MQKIQLPFPTTALAKAAAALSVVLLSACVAPPPQSAKYLSDPDTESVRRIQEVAQAESRKLLEQQERLLAELRKTAAAKVLEPPAPQYDPLEGRTISVSISNGTISQILTAFADAAKVNLIVEPAVVQQGALTDMFLKDVSLREAFNELLRSYDVSGEIRNQTMRIRLHEEKFFAMNFLNVNSQMSLNSGGNVFGSNSSSGNSAISGALSMTASSTQRADPYTEIENNLRAILGENRPANESQPPAAAGARTPQEPTQVQQPNQNQAFTLNRTSGTLFVKARPSQMRAVEKLIKQTQDMLTKQVYIEAQLIDVQLGDGYQLGVDWTQLRSRLALNFGVDALNLTPTGNGSLPGSRGSYPGSSLTIPARAIGSSTGLATGGIGYADTNGSAVINALRNFGNLRILSNPNIQVRNGTPAMLSVGTSLKYVSRSSASQNNVGGGATTTSSEVQTDSVFSGVMVGVLPMMRDDGKIELLINPVQSDVDPKTLELVQVNQFNSVSLPQVAYKGLTTTLNVGDGDVVVVGGLIDQKSSGANSGVPFLADVPVLGKLVSQEGDARSSRELIVVLRVRLL
ncbi:pilus (MSHA type) biogenesis protein MshL [Hydrogenophaga pseudoflava]|uniref:pilus (MSHA type) biogenesis protein MshL n=1 Tax=Hydrogenophaga pseudoflava TaxID=47421 RepID=UPI0027E4F649|nr:pilus (MSHA type) biogenesis protein MshL [Hydrogenophaga pseudoflava]MDQ7745821.1 pilus (MSHA type) biogenesis protein MshL [Hydrogenophaga pseudoflava]